MTNDAICLERARRFSDELIANTESHLQIGEEYGPAVLGLCLYLQQTLLDPNPAPVEVTDCYNHHEITYFYYIIDSLPSRVEWRRFIA
ncbi:MULTISPECIES: hypothetical protein [Aeromonas]|jgi:hypothetical protein|uniref:Uncharacterized protein n=1 Tax=Aeromonas caviae TaxID=648 RepID=A0A7U0LDZ9_AERCA|nr:MULTISPECIES: hypothetical protein [Aeromonas]MDX7722703.1 hypothetical protein [Aeromonas caviae]MEA9434658.1 hypothetical protein [Aeromonas caviae]MEA9441511.1 hypothetical protein [Aeromonas caviae]QQX12783.1 hypothetical protein JC965_27045 [Aeromonas caviae]